jgi:hypothetical protein
MAALLARHRSPLIAIGNHCRCALHSSSASAKCLISAALLILGEDEDLLGTDMEPERSVAVLTPLISPFALVCRQKQVCFMA